MIPKECKRLAEVDFPIAIVSRHAAREKSIRHGLPSTLHLWWARRPLAACRAMLLAVLLPDPCDENCPAEFKEKARSLLPRVPGMSGIGPRDNNLRAALLKFIGDFSNWDLTSNQTYLEVSRALVKASYDETPFVVDPFAGGGSIPLEALRLGCDAFASDLNPVACLILKTMLEVIPRHGAGLAEESRRVGREVKAQAERELAEFYLDDPDGAKPIAYLWARTVRRESPNCGAEIPLMRSFWLSKKANRKRALRCKVVRPKGDAPRVEFEIFEPKSDRDIPHGTVSRAKAACPCCNIVLSPDRLRAQLREQRGGADVIFDKQGKRIGGARMLAVVTLRPGEQGRRYRLPNERDYAAVWKAVRRMEKVAAVKLPNGLSSVPDEPLPWKHGHRSIGSPRVYGMEIWGDYFTARQKLGLTILSAALHCANQDELGNSLRDHEVVALAISKLTELACANCRWEPVAECPRSIFTRHDLPANWDFAEGVITSESSGSFSQVLDNLISNLKSVGADWCTGQVQLASACNSPLPNESAQCFFTDPPYYDAVAYADLSDFFFVWLKRILPSHPLLQDPFDPKNPLVPKADELTVTTVANEKAQPKTKEFFESGIERAFGEGRRLLDECGVGCVVFAHKTTEGWEALLNGLTRSGWIVTASWPITTEMGHRFNAREVAALAASVHLVCRPRTEDKIGDWGDVLRELPKRVGDWMERLQVEGVRGADLVFACIGPALEIFSRYSRVETAEGDEITLAQYLEKVWEVVGRSALEHVLGTVEARARNGAAGALEEDSRLTALFLWTMQSTSADNANGADAEVADEVEEETDEEEEASPASKAKGFSLPFDVVRRFAQPLGIRLPEWEGRIIETKKGVVRLMTVGERAKQLFGEDGAQSIADRIEAEPTIARTDWLPGMEPVATAPVVKGRKSRKAATSADAEDSGEERRIEHRGATTLDRVHAAMLLQSSGRANALRALLKAEIERGPDFVRLANALTALYPAGSEEKRLLEAMLLAAPK
jgi:putative DNA methylase